MLGNLHDLCLTMWIFVGSDAGDGPALLTATIRNCSSAFSFKSGTFAFNSFKSVAETSKAGSHSWLNLYWYNTLLIVIIYKTVRL